MTEMMEQRFLAARRSVIAAQFSNLNPEQQRAVLTTDGPLLLLAGAGSGKTTVLIHRIANLLKYGGGADSCEIPQGISEEDVSFLEQYAPTAAARTAERTPDDCRADRLCALNPAAPWSIIAITFTNKAANELKIRLEKMLGPQALDVWAMTFHAACCRILRRDIDRLGYERSFTIYDSADSERVMKDVLRDMNLDEKTFPPKLCLNLISKAKDKLQTPKDFAVQAKQSGDYRLERIAQAFEEYQKRLKAASATDFDDIILLAVRLLQEHGDLREYYQKKFRYVLIDEYQDTNHLQFLLAKLLSGGYENICVVGDDDQSIYRFRGATIENILSFEKQYQKTAVIRLEQNYRSTKSILNAANAVIANNKGRKGKRLWTNNDTGERITLFEAYSEKDEADFVASRIIDISRGQSFRDFAVLYRTNAQSNAMEYSFKRNGIPYRIIGGTRFFDRAEVKDMLAYLAVINNRADDLRLRRIINTPTRGIGAKTVEMATRMAESAGTCLYAVIADPKGYPAVEKAAAKLSAFTQIIEGCAALLDTLPLPDFYEELMLRTGYIAMLQANDEVENRTRLENIRELKSSIITYMENAEEPSLAGFLEEIALYTDIEQYDQNADAVIMMTMHAAKGLEFPYVFLVGCEEGLFPGARAVGEAEEMEEERRLCYVAITRAKKALFISCAKQRMLYGRTTANRPSRFIDELPEACVTGKVGAKAREPYLESDHSYTPVGGAYGGYVRPLSTARIKAPQKDYNAYSVDRGEQKKMVDFAKGDMVRHTAFGKGMVLSVLPMGGDALLEIAFDELGTKRVMAKTATAHMEKL